MFVIILFNMHANDQRINEIAIGVLTYDNMFYKRLASFLPLSGILQPRVFTSCDHPTRPPTVIDLVNNID